MRRSCNGKMKAKSEGRNPKEAEIRRPNMDTRPSFGLRNSNFFRLRNSFSDLFRISLLALPSGPRTTCPGLLQCVLIMEHLHAIDEYILPPSHIDEDFQSGVVRNSSRSKQRYRRSNGLRPAPLQLQILAGRLLTPDGASKELFFPPTYCQQARECP